MLVHNQKIDKQQKIKNSREEEENYLNLWSYLKRRYPDTDLDSKCFYDLVHIKANLEGPRTLRNYKNEQASVLKR
ncbi:MAG: hypothetical protein HQM13_22965 [SAR324 cluster bacterium]|nr:hypothetical protein [SAR324 cluster bacterium]